MPHSVSAGLRRAPRRRHVVGALRMAAIVLVVAACLLPLAYMVLQSLKTQSDILDPSRLVDFTPTFDNFVRVFEDSNLLRFLVNSVIVAVGSTFLSLLLGIPAAYAMSRYRMDRMVAVVLLARIFPAIGLLLPWYYVLSQLRLVGSYTALIVANMFLSVPLIVWIMVAFFDGLSTELEEAGQVDGLSKVGAFLRISLPLSVPGIATATTLAFIFSWNNFLFSLVLAGNDTRTLPVALFNFVSYASIDWGGLMAASVVITLPVVILALVMQRNIVSGLTAGAMKG